ncbi:MAG: hypothetical protein E6Q69_06500 [Aquipseudomonas alcaligenes]|uniref:Uncharacterized protein n=1 Tax=Aquipseudomonas alcaligenes TaxID=43263 RepID=A0A5C7W636_AQUAC|nr:MAG: hypothetical protein E6Q69_06500 [Pseudomonas alcaligenes]
MSSIYAEFRGKTKDTKKAKEYIKLITLCEKNSCSEEEKNLAKKIGMDLGFPFENQGTWKLSHSHIKATGDIVFSFSCSTTIDQIFFEKQIKNITRLAGRTAIGRIYNSQVGETQFLTSHDNKIEWHAHEQNSTLTDELILIIDEKIKEGTTNSLMESGAEIATSIDEKPTIVIYNKKNSSLAQKAAKKLGALAVETSELDTLLEGWHLYTYTKQKNRSNQDHIVAEQFSVLCGNDDGLLLTLTIKPKGKRHDLRTAAEKYINQPNLDSFQSLAKYLNLSIYNPEGAASYPDISPTHKAPAALAEGLCLCIENNDTVYLGFRVKNISPFINEEINHTSTGRPHVAALCGFYEQFSDKFSGKIYIAGYGYLKGLFSNDGHIYIFNTNEYEAALKANPPYNEKVAARSTAHLPA